jgi:large repetitive protein
VGTLLAGRATWDFTPRWDASLLAASLSDSGGAQRAWGLEVGRSLATNLWLGMGYNFEGFYADPSLSGSSMTRKGLFIRLRMKFDERMFAGKKDGGSSLQPPP